MDRTKSFIGAVLFLLALAAAGYKLQKGAELFSTPEPESTFTAYHTVRKDEASVRPAPPDSSYTAPSIVAERLFQSRAQCEASLGKPTEEVAGLSFHPGREYSTTVRYNDQQLAVRFLYRRNGGGALSDAQVTSLMMAHSRGSKWRELDWSLPQSGYKTEDGKVFAEHGVTGMLEFYASDYAPTLFQEAPTTDGGNSTHDGPMLSVSAPMQMAPAPPPRDILTDPVINIDDSDDILIKFGGRVGLASNMQGIVAEMIREKKISGDVVFRDLEGDIPVAALLSEVKSLRDEIVKPERYTEAGVNPLIVEDSVDAMRRILFHGSLHSDSDDLQIVQFRALLRNPSKSKEEQVLATLFERDLRRYLSKSRRLASLIARTHDHSTSAAQLALLFQVAEDRLKETAPYQANRRLYQTREQSEKHFGKAAKSDEATALYLEGELSVRVYFNSEQKSVMYKYAGQKVKIGPAVTKMLLQAHGGDSKWLPLELDPPKQGWRTEDEKVFAQLSDLGVLTVMAAECATAELIGAGLAD